MNFLQLEYFLTVAQTGHMTKAAEKLYISQPALSKMIKSLESELGVSLFDRVGKNIRLNNYGTLVQSYARSVLYGAEDLTKQINDMKNTMSKEITLSFTASTHYLSSIILSFKSKYPEIDIKINQIPYQKDSRAADLFIYSSLEYPKDSSEILLLSENCSLALSPKHPLTSVKHAISTSEFASLKGSNFFVIQSQMPLHDITLRLCHAAGFNPHIALECDSHATIFSLVDANLGVAIFPNITWKSALSGWNICMKELEVSVYRNILLKAGASYPSDSVRLLKEHIISFYKSIL